MRNQRGSGYSSRVEQRKSKADRMLSWTIGIVSLLILAVGCIILISVFNTSPSSNKTASQSQAASSTSGQSKESKSSDQSSSDSGTSQASNDNESSSDTSSSDTQESDQNHQASYEMGSEDWNAQVHAIAQATGIDETNMTIRWLGNGGSPNSSLARVSPKNNQSAIYVVHLIYKDGHWQADNVKNP